MKYYILFVLIAFGLGTTAPAIAQGAKRDIVAEKIRQHTQKKGVKRGPARPGKGKKKPIAPSDETAKTEVKEKKEEKKKKDKDKDKKEGSGGSSSGGGGSDSKKEEKAKEEPKKEEKKKAGEKRKAAKPKPPVRYFIPESRQNAPVFLTEEQDRAIDQLVRQGKEGEAEEFYHNTHATPLVRYVEGRDQIESRGLSKGAAVAQLMTYLHGKRDKQPFMLHADGEMKEYLNGYIQDHMKNLWIADKGENIEVSYKGNVVGARHPQGKTYAKDTLEQMISMRVMDGRKVPVQFKVVKGERNSPTIQAIFQDASDAESLAVYVGANVQKDAKSSNYYVNMEEGMSKKLLPMENGNEYYAKLTASLARNEGQV